MRYNRALALPIAALLAAAPGVVMAKNTTSPVRATAAKSGAPLQLARGDRDHEHDRGDRGDRGNRGDRGDRGDRSRG